MTFKEMSLGDSRYAYFKCCVAYVTLLSALGNTYILYNMSTGGDVASSELFSKSVDKKCPMAILLPTEKGPGICCKQMLSFLVNMHNELVQGYHSAISTDDKARFVHISGLIKVPYPKFLLIIRTRNLVAIAVALLKMTAFCVQNEFNLTIEK